MPWKRQAFHCGRAGDTSSLLGDECRRTFGGAAAAAVGGVRYGEGPIANIASGTLRSLNFCSSAIISDSRRGVGVLCTVSLTQSSIADSEANLAYAKSLSHDELACVCQLITRVQLSPRGLRYVPCWPLVARCGQLLSSFAESWFMRHAAFAAGVYPRTVYFTLFCGLRVPVAICVGEHGTQCTRTRHCVDAPPTNEITRPPTRA
jgi:hypothetical protein